MNNTHQTWLWEKLAERCGKNLKKKGFDVHSVSDIEEARSVILNMVSAYETFGFGGSYTTRALGVLEALESQGKTIYDHWQQGKTTYHKGQQGNDRDADMAIRLNQGRCDCFFCSANAVSATGEIVNVDGVGNRTAAMTFGPKKVVIVVGMNKVTWDLESALKRVREIAAPMRAKSLDTETPCAETGICNDCNVPGRICRITTILHCKPLLTDVSVILVHQGLGF